MTQVFSGEFLALSSAFDSVQKFFFKLLVFFFVITSHLFAMQCVSSSMNIVLWFLPEIMIEQVLARFTL